MLLRLPMFAALAAVALSTPAHADNTKAKPATAKAADVSMVLVIDRSGSMTGAKMKAAKTAVLASIKTLPQNSRVAVVAFDAKPVVALPMTASDQTTAIETSVRRIKAAGGTHILPALEKARDLLAATQAAKKHVIVLSDGHSSYSGLGQLATDMKAAGMTVSAVGVGSFDRSLLQLITSKGGARLHTAATPSELPKLFALETRLATTP